MNPFSLYFHIPYCFHKCPYCDFNTYAVANVPDRDYTSALLAELDFRASLLGWKDRSVKTIYFGGGTPSLLSGEIIEKILGFVRGSFAVLPGAEISLEANPGAVILENLELYRRAGVNRISFGAQSFNQQILSNLGRIHSVAQIEEGIELARTAGFDNLNLDLIYGTPGQTLTILKQDIKHALSLSPTHISAYGLTIEKGTPFFERFKRKTLVLPVEDAVVKMMEELCSTLPQKGYEHYEISNFAQPGYEARHNLAYWNGDDYLGIGAGAHSFLAQADSDGRVLARRWSNFALPAKYMREATTQGSAESWKDTLRKRDLVFEYFFLGLRKMSGVSILEFEKKFNRTIDQTYPALLNMLHEQELLEINESQIRLSKKGLMFADSVIENFSEPILDPIKIPSAA